MLLIIPNGKLPVRMYVMANLTSLNKLPNTRVFVTPENGSVEVTELRALFLLETETCDAKNC